MTDFCVDGTTPLSQSGMPQDEPFAPVQRPAFREALRFWFKLGWVSFAGDFHFWKTLVLFFTKTAFVTIGGSYTVIP